jgi:hypothetical protein
MAAKSPRTDSMVLKPIAWIFSDQEGRVSMSANMASFARSDHPPTPDVHELRQKIRVNGLNRSHSCGFKSVNDKLNENGHVIK